MVKMNSASELLFKLFLLFICSSLVKSLKIQSNICSQSDIFYSVYHCFNNKDISETNVYILYDINPGEGFNLRRDVYVRLAVFMEYLRKQSDYRNAYLVLPPYRRLYHWKSSDIDQKRIFWNNFFDLSSLKKYTAVLDIWEFFQNVKRYSETDQISLDYVLTLQNYENMFENGNFVDKFEVTKIGNRNHVGDGIFGYKNMTSKNELNVLYQGSVMLLHRLLKQLKPKFYQPNFYVLINHAEIVLHDTWGSKEYWKARRSMRFNKNLVAIANEFIKTKLTLPENVQRPIDWRDEKPFRKAIGGEYLCAHIRRSDFIYGREATTPSLRSVVNQIKVRLKQNNLTKIFISSDCSRSEYKTLKSSLVRYNVHRFTPKSIEQKSEIKDGGVAIVDQIICSYAKYFIGTYESTFTYRIYEEREILGFPKDSTFNTFCKSDMDNGDECQKNSVWLIAY